MELGLCLDDDFYTEETVRDKPKAKPYNVKLCEREWIFDSPICSDKVEKQNITKFKADVWYRNGQYSKAFKSYKFIQEHPQVSSSTVEREINESVARCHIKMKQFDEAVHVIQSMLKDHGDDTSLILMLAEICSATDNIQGETDCLKRCISLHSYNHRFWYSLALVYDKACQNQNIPNTKHNAIANGVTEALEKNKTTNHKDSVKIFINCSHCKCFGERDLEENDCLKMSDENKHAREESKTQHDQEEGLAGCNSGMDEIIFFMKNLSIHDEKAMQTRTEGDSNNLSKSEDTTDVQSSQASLNDSHGYEKNSSSATLASDPDTNTQDQGSCSFSVKLKSSKYYQHQTKESHNTMSLKEQQKLCAFFCLIRARFHLQRAIWTSSSFIKEKLASEMAQVNERIDKYVLCKCGELKKCCVKRIASEDSALISDQ